MKYRTIIEVICNAGDKDEACNIAGDYLKGNIDFGVEMKCRTESLAGHRITKYAATFAVLVLLTGTFVFRITPVSVQETTGAEGGLRIGMTPATHTVMPELKTRHREEFRQDWQDRKDAAILEYLKK